MTAFVLGLPETKVRVIAPDVGGGFGSKIYLYPEETAMVWASKQVNRPIKVDRGAQRVIPVRCARPRSRHARRVGARQGRQVPRDARAHDRGDGRVSVDVRVVHSDDPLRDVARRAVHDAGDLLRSHRGVHQHGARRRVSRRGTARGDVRRRAPGACSGRGNGHSRRTRSVGAISSARFPIRRPSRLPTTSAATTRASTKR